MVSVANELGSAASVLIGILGSWENENYYVNLDFAKAAYATHG